jgi:hypothetical protein
MALKKIIRRVSEADVQFRAGSSLRQTGGTTHPAAQIVQHPNFNYYTIDFDIAIARVSNFFYP